MAVLPPVEFISIYTDADAPRGRFYLAKTVPTYQEAWDFITELKSKTTAPTDMAVPTEESPDFETESFPASVSIKFTFPVESSVVTYEGGDNGFERRTFARWIDPSLLAQIDNKIFSL